jgi:hypothetical protein
MGYDQIRYMGAMGSSVSLAFSPTQIAGLKLWLKADSMSLADGTAISTWSDQSGNGNDATQATGANQPLFKTNVLNEKPVVRFDGSNDYMAFATGPDTSSCFVVGTINVAASSLPAYACFIIYGDVNNGGQIRGRVNSTHWGAFITTVADLDSGEDLVSRTFSVLELTTVASNGGVFLYRNGTQKATDATHNCYGAGTNQINWIGGETGQTRYISADMAEVLIYDSALSTSDRQTVETYLKNKYGL